jgi:UDP-N-acetylglucosamine pyrophosphorylase
MEKQEFNPLLIGGRDDDLKNFKVLAGNIGIDLIKLDRFVKSTDLKMEYQDFLIKIQDYAEGKLNTL